MTSKILTVPHRFWNRVKEDHAYDGVDEVSNWENNWLCHRDKTPCTRLCGMWHSLTETCLEISELLEKKNS